MPKTSANTQTNRDGFEVLSKRRSEISRYQARGSRDDAQASGAVFACGYATLERCRIRREKSGTARSVQTGYIADRRSETSLTH